MLSMISCPTDIVVSTLNYSSAVTPEVMFRKLKSSEKGVFSARKQSRLLVSWFSRSILDSLTSFIVTSSRIGPKENMHRRSNYTTIALGFLNRLASFAETVPFSPKMTFPDSSSISSLHIIQFVLTISSFKVV